MQVFEAVGAALHEAGVKAVFGLMGDGNLRFLSHLAGPVGIPYYGTRHETAAIAMADGYARVTGEVAVCTVTQGPGVTNAITALTAAAKGATPMLLLTGDTPSDVPEHIQGADHRALFEAAGVGVQVLRRPETVVEDIRRGVRRARREHRPVAISIPTDLQEAPCAAPEDTIQPRAPLPVVVEPDPASISEAVDLIELAARPVIIAGRGAVRADAQSELIELGERIGALLATTVPAKSLFDGDAYSVGIAGDFSTELGTELIGGADLLLVVGASLNYWTTANGELVPPGTMVIHCDLDERAIGAYTPVTHGVVGDARAAAVALIAECERRDVTKSGYRSAIVRDRIASFDVRKTFTPRGDERSVDPRTLALALNDRLHRDRVVSVDGGHFTGFPSMYIDVPDPRSFLFAVNFGAVGLGLGTAMGAAIGMPDRLVVAFVGDGGLLMSLGDLETAQRYRLPVLVVVMNDGAFGAELHHLGLLGMPVEHSIFGDVDLAGAARGLGLRAATVRSIDDLKAVDGWLSEREGPFVLDCKVDRDVRAEWLEQAVRPQLIARQRKNEPR